MKGNICPILERAEATRILKDVRGRSSSTLSSKLFLRKRKPSLPLRSVVNEKETWQGLLSSFLKNWLNHVRWSGSLSVRNSDELLSKQTAFHGKNVVLLSLDIKYPYYSLNHDVLLQRTTDILEIDSIDFQGARVSPLITSLNSLNFICGLTL